MRFAKKTMHRLLYVGTTIVVLFILYSVLVKRSIFEGATPRKQRKSPSPYACSSPIPTNSAPTISVCGDTIFSNFKSKGQDVSVNLRNSLAPSCSNDPNNFSNCLNAIYRLNRPKPSDDTAVASINQCMKDPGKYDTNLLAKIDEWKQNNWTPKTYNKILETINKPT